MSDNFNEQFRTESEKEKNSPAFDPAALIQDAAENKDRSSESSRETIDLPEVPAQSHAVESKAERKRRGKPLFIFGAICIAVFILALSISPRSSVDTSDAAKQAIVDRISTTLSVGAVLSAKDANTAQQDYTITHSDNQKDTKIWIWDYAAEDGDYVQVLVDGMPLGDAFMIKHKPVELTVPTVASVQIKGVRDGGGGITYAVHYDLNNTTYFNAAPVGGVNTYTLVRE